MAMSLRTVFVAALLVCGTEATASHANASFPWYIQAYGRNYAQGSAEYRMREQIFNRNLADIVTHNQAGRSWKKGVNDFTDYTEPELQALRGYKRPHREGNNMLGGSSVMQLGSDIHDRSCGAKDQSCSNTAACCGALVCGSYATCEEPAADGGSKDWSSLATSKVIMNQGGCGSCWALAASAAVQLQAAKLNPGFKSILSPESINKCAPNPHACGGTGGCQGSTPALAFDYLKDIAKVKRGLVTTDSLPYTANTDADIPETDGDCKDWSSSLSFLQTGNFRRTEAASVIVGDYIKLPDNHAEKVMSSLVNVGPLAVAVVGSGIQGYSEGVLDACSSAVVDHAVVMMGYGKDHSSDMLYWNIRNSWGKNWGENGFFRLQRHYVPNKSPLSGDPMEDKHFQGEPCAWDNDPAKGVACKDAHGNYPKRTRVCGVCGIVSDVSYPIDITVNSKLLL